MSGTYLTSETTTAGVLESITYKTLPVSIFRLLPLYFDPKPQPVYDSVIQQSIFLYQSACLSFCQTK